MIIKIISFMTMQILWSSYLSTTQGRVFYEMSQQQCIIWHQIKFQSINCFCKDSILVLKWKMEKQ